MNKHDIRKLSDLIGATNSPLTKTKIKQIIEDSLDDSAPVELEEIYMNSSSKHDFLFKVLCILDEKTQLSLIDTLCSYPSMMDDYDLAMQHSIIKKKYSEQRGFSSTDKDESINFNGIFISHSSYDKNKAEALCNYLERIGFSGKDIFCSTVPGNGVESKISEEIRQKLSKSAIFIILLSDNYFKSVYCLNEMGVIWYLDREILLISKPGFDRDKFKGFLFPDYIIREIGSGEDSSLVYDTLRKYLDKENDATTVSKARKEMEAVFTKKDDNDSKNEEKEINHLQRIESQIMNGELNSRELDILLYYKENKTCSFIPEYSQYKDDLNHIMSVMIQMAKDGFGTTIKDEWGNDIGLEIDIKLLRLLDKIELDRFVNRNL